MRSVHLLSLIAAFVVGVSEVRAEESQPSQLTEEEVLARYKHEPTVQQVQDAAIRYYQVWYRNAAAFCTPSTFNTSNGYAVTWQP